MFTRTSTPCTGPGAQAGPAEVARDSRHSMVSPDLAMARTTPLQMSMKRMNSANSKAPITIWSEECPAAKQDDRTFPSEALQEGGQTFEMCGSKFVFMMIRGT